MIVLFGKTSGPKARRYFGSRTNLGIMVGPKGWVNAWCPHWACDNDAYSTRHDPGYWCREGEAKWLKMLDKAAAQPSKPLFCVLPDVVGDWTHTLWRAHRYRHEVVERSLPVAIALQDGADFSEAMPLHPAFVFVGGSTEWKWQNAHLACTYFQPQGVKVHVGRASGPERITRCLRMGADSCDGTGWGAYADKMLPGLWRALDGFAAQTTLVI